jgi:hypothetical protein
MAPEAAEQGCDPDSPVIAPVCTKFSFSFEVLLSGCRASWIPWKDSGAISVNLKRIGVQSGRGRPYLHNVLSVPAADLLGTLSCGPRDLRELGQNESPSSSFEYDSEGSREMCRAQVSSPTTSK